MRVGTETLECGVLLTRVRRNPPMWTLECVAENGKMSKALMTKAPKGQRGWYVQISEEYGFDAFTRKEAIRTFQLMSEAAAKAAPIKEEDNE